MNPIDDFSSQNIQVSPYGDSVWSILFWSVKNLSKLLACHDAPDLVCVYTSLSTISRCVNPNSTFPPPHSSLSTSRLPLHHEIRMAPMKKKHGSLRQLFLRLIPIASFPSAVITLPLFQSLIFFILSKSVFSRPRSYALGGCGRGSLSRQRTLMRQLFSFPS
jgi:hypothetical protein